MADQSRKTISLFLFIPEERAIILSRREEGQKHPSLLQATVHGSIEQGETHFAAIERELKEETGLDIVDIGPVSFLGELSAGYRVPEDCSFYLAPIGTFNAVKLTATEEVAEFVPLTAESARHIVTFEKAKEKNIDPHTRPVMFTDELEALREAYALLAEHEWAPPGMEDTEEET